MKNLKKIAAMMMAIMMMVACANAYAEEIEDAEMTEIIEQTEEQIEEIVEIEDEAVIETVEEVVIETVEEVIDEIAEETVEEVTEEVTEETAEEIVLDDAMLIATMIDALDANRSIGIYLLNSELVLGEKAELYAALNGYENASYEIQWQVSTDNVNWNNVEGAVNQVYSFELSEESFDLYFRVQVNVTAVDVQ